MKKLLIRILNSVKLYTIFRNAIGMIMYDDTEIISKEALVIIRNPEKAMRLRRAIDYYHSTGTWEGSGLQELYNEI